MIMMINTIDNDVDTSNDDNDSTDGDDNEDNITHLPG